MRPRSRVKVTGPAQSSALDPGSLLPFPRFPGPLGPSSAPSPSPLVRLPPSRVPKRHASRSTRPMRTSTRTSTRSLSSSPGSIQLTRLGSETSGNSARRSSPRSKRNSRHWRRESQRPSLPVPLRSSRPPRSSPVKSLVTGIRPEWRTKWGTK